VTYRSTWRSSSLRTPHMRDNIEQSHARLMDGVTRSLITKKDAFAGLLAAQRRTNIKAAQKLAREMREAYLSGEIEVTVKPEFSLLAMFEHCSTYAEFMSLCRWEVITFPDESQLITSDCPVHFRSENHVALADPETLRASSTQSISLIPSTSAVSLSRQMMSASTWKTSG